MPLRNDASLWWNMAGVVAAYQPVRAPGSMLGRSNMACGNNNKYIADSATKPIWSSVGGWSFDGISTYLDTNLIMSGTTWSAFVRYSGASTSGATAASVIGSNSYSEAQRGISLWPHHSTFGRTNARVWVGNGIGRYVDSSNTSTGVIGLSGIICYHNGLVISTSNWFTPGTGNTSTTYIGAVNASGVAKEFFNGAIQSVVVLSRTISLTEAWNISHQMAYCDVNPDWSVWGRRRRWYYDSVLPTFQAAWAAHSNAQIGTGVN